MDAEKEVAKKVQKITEDLKLKHSKFEDPDFGPTDNDEHGAVALYGPGGPPPPAGHSKYPAPDTIVWQRPQYLDTKFVDVDEEKKDEEDEDEDEDDEFAPKSSSNEVWCMNGQLFVGGTSSGDVVQGNYRS